MRKILFVLGFVLTFGPGCGKRADPIPDGTGILKVAVVTTSGSGVTYRLSQATFDIVGASSTTSVSTTSTPDVATLVVPLPSGSYRVFLREGWQLARVPTTGAPSIVDARLTSANPQECVVHSGRTTDVRFSFTLTLDAGVGDGGSIAIGIEVNDTPDSGTPNEGSFTELGSGAPVDVSGNPGVVLWPTFVDADQPNLMTAIICDAAITKAKCRPASSFNRGASWTLHDSPNFASVISTLGLGTYAPPVAARSPANTRRLYFALGGHPEGSLIPPGGALWRSDDDGQTWTTNLRAGEAGESGMITHLVPDPTNADTVWIQRGYSYGNVSVSRNAGATFTIVCGRNNTTTTGIDACTSGLVVLDFERQRLYVENYFNNPGYEFTLAGAQVGSTFIISGVGGVNGGGWGSMGIGDYAYDLPIKGLRGQAGTASSRFLSDGSGQLYAPRGSGKLWLAAPDLRTGAAVSIPTLRDVPVLVTHTQKRCTWLAQATDLAFNRTTDCGATWTMLPTTGLPAGSKILAAAMVPRSNDVVVFLNSGRRFQTTLPE